MIEIAEQMHPTASEFALPPGSDVAELRLLLPVELAVQLEEMARKRGLTTGQMLRRGVQALLNAERTPLPFLGDPCGTTNRKRRRRDCEGSAGEEA